MGMSDEKVLQDLKSAQANQSAASVQAVVGRLRAVLGHEPGEFAVMVE